MRAHPRIRKTLKWGGLVVALFITGLWLLSVYRPVGYQFSSNGSLGISNGCCDFFYDNSALLKIRFRGWFDWPNMHGNRWWFADYSTPGVLIWFIPFWPLILLSLGFAALGWYLDARARRFSRVGACPTCGYDLSGLAPGTACPECGNRATPAG